MFKTLRFGQLVMAAMIITGQSTETKAEQIDCEQICSDAIFNGMPYLDCISAYEMAKKQFAK